MGGFLILQPAGGAVCPAPVFERVRDWLGTSRGLALLDDVGGTSRAAKLSRQDGSGARAAISANGWLVSAGLWDHPDAPASNDTAWLLRTLDSRGESCLDRLDGFYALAWFHGGSGSLTVVTDHLGRLHVYAGEGPEGAWVSTSAAAVAGGLGAGPDPVGVFELLTTGTIYETRSLFAGARRLQAATRCVYRSGRLQSTASAPGVTPPPRPAGRVPPVDVVEACTTRMVRLLQPFARPCADLSGGRDSRLVVGLMRRAGLRFDASVSGAHDSPDVVRASALARSLGLHLEHRQETALLEAQGSFVTVLRAAAIADGAGDAVERASTMRPQGGAAAAHDITVGGAGGEVYRESWWKAGDIGSRRAAVERSLRRFTKSRAVLEVPFLGDGARRDGADHFSGVIARALAGRESEPLPSQLDHLYLNLRTQCWQGTNASALNQVQPKLYPLLLRSPLELVLTLDASEKVGDRLFHLFFQMMERPFATTPLATGFPPLDLTPSTAWRFAACAPGWAGRRIAKKLRPRHRDQVDDLMPPVMVRLFREGAADYLAPARMALLPLLLRAPFEAFLDTATHTGRVPPALVGRLLAAEFALRAAAGMRSG